MRPSHTAIQDALAEAVDGGLLERVFLARARRGRGIAISILACAPADTAPPQSRFHPVRLAARHAVVSAHTVLLHEGHDGALRRGRGRMLCAAPIILDEQQVWGAVVAVGRSVRPDGQGIGTVKRLAQQVAQRLQPGSRPANVVTTPSLGPVSPAWPTNVAYDVLLHELRAPLGAAGHALDVLAHTRHEATSADDGWSAQLVHMAYLSVVEAQSLVRWFSQLRKFTKESAPLRIEAVSVMKAINSVVALLSPCAHVDIEGAADAPLVAADSLWLTQILINLIENAVKYSPASDPVQVVVRRVAPHHVCVSVMDTGPGIPPDRQQEVFRPYVRCAPAADLTSQGLGLSIARDLARAMDGDMWVESDGHTGTVLSFTVPIAGYGDCE